MKNLLDELKGLLSKDKRLISKEGAKQKAMFLTGCKITDKI